MSYETRGYPPPTSYYGYGDQHKHPAYEQRIADLEAKVERLTLKLAEVSEDLDTMPRATS